MIRLALAFLGWSVGGAAAQGTVPTAPLLETCGGTRLVLASDGAPDPDAIEAARDVVNVRVGGLLSSVFDYAEVQNGRIVVSLTDAMIAGGATPEALAPLMARVEFGFHDVDRRITGDTLGDVAEDHVVLPSATFPDERFVVARTPVLTGAQVALAQPTFDMNSQPAVSFEFSGEGRDIFARYTTENVGEPFAIVLNDEVLSAPVIREPILAGRGIITGAFTVAETTELALTLQGGVLPFDLEIVEELRVDGSDPSADFCP